MTHIPSVIPDTWSNTQGSIPQAGSTRSPAPSRRLYTRTFEPDLMSKDQARDWFVSQTPVENLASRSDVAERACAWVRSILTEYQSRMHEVRQMWRVLDLLCKGESVADLSSIGINVVASHEILKAVERLVPRIEAVLHQKDPWFRPRALSPEFQDDEDAVMAYMLHQHRNAGFANLWQPAIRNMLVYQVSALKLRWDRRVAKRTRVEMEREIVGERIVTRVRRNKVDAKIFDGPRFDLVNPYSFIIDPSVVDAAQAAWIGDEKSEQLNVLRSQQELGHYVNVDKIQTSKSGSIDNTRLGGFEQLAASLSGPPMGQVKHGPQYCRVVEMWGLFDLYGDGNPIECQVVVADDSVCLRAAENPFELSKRPYAVARSARWGNGFFNVGVMDVAARVSEHLDLLRSVTQHATVLGMTPIVFTERQDASLPYSLAGAVPGQVFQGGGRVQPIQISGDTRAHLPLAQTYQRDIQDLTGAPDSLSGIGDTNTATEAMRNLTEANERVAGLIRAYGSMLNQAMEIQHALNKTYVIADQTFPILGKAAQVLARHYGSVTPASFLGEMAFEFDGLQAAYRKQSRAQGIATFMQQAGAILPALGSSVNLIELLRDSFEELTGDSGSNIFNVPPLPHELAPQSTENLALAAGRRVEVHRLDPHDRHLEDMGPLLQAVAEGQITNPRAIEEIASHFVAHLEAAATARNAAAVEAAQRPAQPPDGETAANRNAQASGVSDVPMADQRGTTPGSGTLQQVAKPGRNQPNTQA